MATVPDGGASRSVQSVAELLGRVSLWTELDDELRDEIAAVVEVEHVPAGGHVFRHGDPGDALYLVMSGRLEVVNPAGTTIGVLGGGAAVGELALLTGQPRTASVRAMRDTELLRLDRLHFEQLLRANAEFAANLISMLGHRLAGTVERRTAPERRGVVAVIGMTPELPVDLIVDDLQRTVERWSSVGRLRAADHASDDDVELGRALDRREQVHDVVLLAASTNSDAAWREFCLRQADRLLLVVDARDRPTDPADDRLLDDRLVGRDIAFVGVRPPTADATAPWLDRLRPEARHWIGQGDDQRSGTARVARRMFGRSIGIVFSGGGARGLAHIGVVSALRDAGIEIDRYGGTSMGAFVAALFATGRTPEAVTDVLRHEVAERRPFADYTVPRHALIRSRRAKRMFRRVFGELQLEELPYDCFGVSADLITGDTLVHRRGPIRHVVGASMSLPGLAPPMPWAGRLMVDGGVVNNLPVDVMADTGEGPVVAVEVMRRWQQEWEYRMDRARRSPRARPRSTPVPLPSLVETLSCSIGLGSRAELDAARDRAWLTVVPELPDLGLLDWGRLDDAIAEGRRAAEVALASQEHQST